MGVEIAIYYAKELLIGDERHYNTIERKVLLMIYSVGDFRLANHFIFYVNCQALLPLVNCMLISGRIARRIFSLQYYNFEITYRPRRNHVMADHLSCTKTGGAPMGMLDHF